MKTDGNGRKNPSPISISIFLAETGPESGKKIELTMDEDIRKYENGQIRMKSQKIKLE
jgi:hypothetical protein